MKNPTENEHMMWANTTYIVLVYIRIVYRFKEPVSYFIFLTNYLLGGIYNIQQKYND